MRSRIRSIGALFGLAMFVAAGPAQAGRAVVDFGADPDNPQYGFTSGYCDIAFNNNTDCMPRTLPYSVQFSTSLDPSDVMSASYNQILNYGDGTVVFGDSTSFPMEGFGGTYGTTFITGGLDESVSRDAINNFVFNQSTRMNIFSNGAIQLAAYFCVSTSSCNNIIYVLDLVPQADGFAASVTYNLGGKSEYGYGILTGFGEPTNLTGITPTAGSTYNFFVPAQITGLPQIEPNPQPVDSAVPEPSTWMAMLTGFGMIGMAVRRRRPKASPAATA